MKGLFAGKAGKINLVGISQFSNVFSMSVELLKIVGFPKDWG